MGGEVPEMTTFTTEDRIAIQSSMNANEPVGNMCLGCGSSWSDERLEIERRLKPNLISCCPDRKVVPVYARQHPDNLGLAESIIKQQQLKIDNLLENNARLDAEINALKASATLSYNKGHEDGRKLATVKELTEWIGAEEWEPLAWELCADEHGEESCTDLIWDTGVIPEPWGDRWQKYEDEAKRMIYMVRKCTHPVKKLTDEEITACMGCLPKYNSEIGDEDLVMFARAIPRKAQEK